jgi:hypothetical protein
VAFDLHFYDIVHAVPEEEDGGGPKITAVVTRSGHKTLRVIFAETTTSEQTSAVLSWLGDAHATYEQAWARFYAIDVEPEADYSAVCDYLWELQGEGVLNYENGITSEETAP